MYRVMQQQCDIILYIIRLCVLQFYILFYSLQAVSIIIAGNTVGWLSVEVIYFFLKKYFYLNGKHVFFFLQTSLFCCYSSPGHILTEWYTFNQDFSSNNFIMFVVCTSIRNELSNCYYNNLYDYYSILGIYVFGNLSI